MHERAVEERIALAQHRDVAARRELRRERRRGFVVERREARAT